MIRVLHVIQQLSSGGASKALEALITSAERSSHSVLSLIPTGRKANERLLASGIPIIQKPSKEEVDRYVREADIVQIHFWNTPELYKFMETPRSCRIVIWTHVEGLTAPHIVIPQLTNYSNALVHTCYQKESDSYYILPRSPHTFKPEERSNNQNQPLCVGIFGTLHSSRMCVKAIEVFAMADCQGSQLLIVGQGDLVPVWKQRVAKLNLHGKVIFRGFVDDVGRELANMDVLLHLPKPGCYATADLALQEALLTGVVPIVLDGTAVANLVRHEIDGLVAIDEHQSVQFLQRLDKDRKLLQGMREAGQERAKYEFHPCGCAREFEALYERIFQMPKQVRSLILTKGDNGAERFMASIGDASIPFQISAKRASGWQAADKQIADSNSAIAGAGAGGILHYRGVYPDDPFLRYWAGLVLAASGRSALAAAEFDAASKAGIIGVSAHLKRCLHSQ